MTPFESYFQINPNKDMPLYKQIQDNLIELIELGLLKPQDTLPSERDLSNYYGVNRMTVRQAISELVQMQLLERQHGVGTFVTERKPIQQFMPTVMGFTERMRQAGVQPSSQLIQKRIERPTPLVAHRLEIDAQAEVIVLERLRLTDDEALMVETSYLPQARFPALAEDFTGGSLYRFLKQVYDVAVQRTEQTLEPTLTHEREAKLMEVPEKSPAMLVRVLAYDADHLPIEFSKSVVRGDRCRYYFRVNTTQPIMR